MKLQAKSAAFFDLDLTITRCDSFRCFLSWHYFTCHRNILFIPYVAFFAVLRKMRTISLQQFKEKSLIGLKGKHRSQIQNIGNHFFLSRLQQLIRKKAVHQIEFHKQRKDLPFILSASPDIYMKPVSQFLGCVSYECSALKYDNDHFTGEFKGSDCIGNQKLIRALWLAEKYGIDMSTSFAFSDNESDVPLLQAVGNPVAVSPTSRLRSIAERHGWTIEFW